jgi:hypothetical protein
MAVIALEIDGKNLTVSGDAADRYLFQCPDRDSRVNWRFSDGNRFARNNRLLGRSGSAMATPVKNGLITVAGDEDGDIPELTAEFVLGGAQIEQPDVFDRD